MSSLLTTKNLGIVGGIAGLSAVGGGVAYGAGLFSDSKPEKIVNNKTKLQDEGFVVLDAEADSTEWGKILVAYQAAKTGTFKEGGGEDKSRTDQQLKEECQRQLNLNTDESYKLTRQWCVKQEQMKTILGRKLKILSTESTQEDNEIWRKKIDNLTDNDKSTLTITLEGGDIWDKDSKAKCKLFLDKKTTDTEFNQTFDAVKRVCTVPKS